jgi:integrase/recombinase XerD
MSALDDCRMTDRFIRSLRLRNPESVTVYQCIVRHFQRFVGERSHHAPVSPEIIRLWLEARQRDLPLPLVYHRARLVDRVLDWLVTARAIPRNPFAEWRHDYRQRTTTPIVRALLSPNVDAALEALRPLPPFGSSLGTVLQAHIARMRSLGYRYDTDAARLLRFDRFLQTRADLNGQPLRVLIQAWANAGSPPRAPGVRRPRVTSGLLAPRPRCRSTSRQASVRDTPNVAARGRVLRPRTQPVDGPW